MSLTCAGVAVLWVSQWLELLRIMDVLIPGTILCASTASLYLRWLASKEQRIRELQATCMGRLKELKTLRF